MTALLRHRFWAIRAYGNNYKFRHGITELGLSYVLGVQGTTTVWKPGQGPLPPKSLTGRGRTPTRMQRNKNTSTGFGQATGPLVVSPALEERLLARRHLRDPAFPFRRSSHSSRSSGSRAPLAASERVVVGRVGPRPHPNRSGTGSPLLGPIPRFPIWPVRPNSAGSSNATIRNSSRNSVWDTTKVAAGVDFTIMAPYVLPLMGSWSPSGAVFPPLHLSSMLDYPSPNSPNTSNPAEPRIRPERHNPCSIATLRIRIARFLIQQLPRCPFCGPLRL